MEKLEDVPRQYLEKRPNNLHYISPPQTVGKRLPAKQLRKLQNHQFLQRVNIKIAESLPNGQRLLLKKEDRFSGEPEIQRKPVVLLSSTDL